MTVLAFYNLEEISVFTVFNLEIRKNQSYNSNNNYCLEVKLCISGEKLIHNC